jgi:prepilin-type processing-associated H-X9-DG protein
VYWTGIVSDADKDDYSQTPSFKEDGSKGVQTPILFADGHVQSFDRFDATIMTARYEGVGEGNVYPWSP